MPHSPSALKRMRTSAKSRALNISVLSEIHTLKKSFRAQAVQFAGQKDKKGTSEDELKKSSRHLISRIDSAAQKGVIPKRRADRLKARVDLALNKAQTAPA